MGEGDFKIEVFKDKKKYCRFPIFIGGEKQIHIMQPFNEEGHKYKTPRNSKEWFKLSKDHGQIVFSLEVLEIFIDRLRKIKERMTNG